MEDSDIVYLAGIVDGEGCINIVKYHKDNRYRYRLQLRVINTCKELVDWVEERFGGYITSRQRPNLKVVYEWYIADKAAELLLYDMLDYLIVKRQQAYIALDFRATYGRVCYKQGGLSQEVIDMRDAQKDAISNLNKGIVL